MNIVIKNQNYKIIDSLSIEVIKTFDGEVTREMLEASLVNFYYNKAIIDITAIKNYFDISNLINFLSFFDTNKIIILLNDNEIVNSKAFLGTLVRNGYYNFTRNAAGINYLLTNSNEYKDVEIYTREENVNNLNPFVQNNSNNQVGSNQMPSSFSKNANQRIIGIQNLTEHAGSTTLMYMMVKQLSKNYKTLGIEMFKQDSIYFRRNDIVHCTSIDDLKIRITNSKDIEVIIVDLNDLKDLSVIDDGIYLVEPGTIKINKLIKKNVDLESIINKNRIVLNRSSVKDDELSAFEYETKLKVFFNMSNFNERKESILIIDNLLVKLGFNKQSGKKGGLFSIFK